MGPLDSLLITFLEQLPATDWQRTTSAPGWRVTDVAAHLLDTKLRRIAQVRDGHLGSAPFSGDLVAHLNALNRTWVEAFDRISPALLTELHRAIHPNHIATYATAVLEEQAPFGVSWAGQDASPNWFHLAREYTEQWHHQQQIRQAFDDTELLRPAWYGPYLDTCLRALPFWLGPTPAPVGTKVCVRVAETGQSWAVVRALEGWTWTTPTGSEPHVLQLRADFAWKLLSHGLTRVNLPEGAYAWNGAPQYLAPLLGAIAVVK